MAKKHQGACACGAVRFEFETDPDFIAVCHCLDCKRATGGEAAAFMGVPEAGFTLLSGSPIAFSYIADSGLGLDRNFCRTCGARVFTSHLGAFPGTIFVTLGALEDRAGITPNVEMFVRRRLPWVTPLDIPQYQAMPG
jgi:hypothetical protein